MWFKDEWKPFRFGKKWGWVNYDNFHFCGNYPFYTLQYQSCIIKAWDHTLNITIVKHFRLFLSNDKINPWREMDSFFFYVNVVYFFDLHKYPGIQLNQTQWVSRSISSILSNVEQCTPKNPYFQPSPFLIIKVRGHITPLFIFSLSSKCLYNHPCPTKVSRLWHAQKRLAASVSTDVHYLR